MEASRVHNDHVASSFVHCLGKAVLTLLVVVVVISACLSALGQGSSIPPRALSAMVSDTQNSSVLRGSGQATIASFPGPAVTGENSASSVDRSTWHRGVCDDKQFWPGVRTQCNGCEALVNHADYGFTCDGYCGALGLQCIGAHAPMHDNCDAKYWSECSKPILNTSGAICECITPCSLAGGECSSTKCCANPSEKCFEGAEPGELVCMESCVPGEHGTCKAPFDHPLAIARQTWSWPDVACVVSAGEVLVELAAFRGKYESDCQNFCKHGASKVVGQNGWGKNWFSLYGSGAGLEETCPGHLAGHRKGARCHCSFPDRL